MLSSIQTPHKSFGKFEHKSRQSLANKSVSV